MLKTGARTIYKLEYLNLAENDIEQYALSIYEYTAHKEAAIRFLTGLQESILQIKDFPYACAIFNPVKPIAMEVRMKPYGNYNIYYTVSEPDKTITILRVTLSKKDIF